MGLAVDELDAYGLRRCHNCGGKLIRATEQKILRQHVGHHMSPPGFLHINEWLRIKLGLL